jgi:hypothetical protein
MLYSIYRKLYKYFFDEKAEEVVNEKAEEVINEEAIEVQHNPNELLVPLKIFYSCLYSDKLTIYACRYILEAYKYNYYTGPYKLPKKRDLLLKLNYIISSTLPYNKNKNQRSQDYHELIDIVYTYFPGSANAFRINEHEFTMTMLRNFVEVPQPQRRHPPQITSKTRIQRIEQQKIYNDSQNVHANNINNTVLDACIKLISDYKVKDEKKYMTDSKNILLKKFKHNYSIIEKIYRNINKNKAKFGNYDSKFSLQTFYCSLFEFIKRHKNCDEILKILIIEFQSMDGYCSTGHLSRLLNSIQGFTDEYSIKISDRDRVNAIVTHNINKLLQKESEKVLNGMIDKQNNEEYLKFINTTIEKIIVEFELDRDIALDVVNQKYLI